MRSPRDLGRHLASLANVADPDGHELGAVLRDRALDVAQLLGVDEHDVLHVCTMPDRELAPKILTALGRVRRTAQAQRATSASASAQAAASMLASGALLDGARVILAPGLLLGPLLVDPAAKLVVFLLPADKNTAVKRADLLATSRALRSRDDLTSYVDPQGVHVRWRCGRGGLNWLPQPLPAHEMKSALIVDLTHAAPTRRPLPIRPAASRWSWDVLAELGAAS